MRFDVHVFDERGRRFPGSHTGKFMHHVIDALFHRHFSVEQNLFSSHGLERWVWRAIETRCSENRNHEIAAHAAWRFGNPPSRFAAHYSETIVPTFFPSTMSVKLLGLFMSKTTIGILLSMHRLNAVESIT